jgi:hypothetical protein
MTEKDKQKIIDLYFEKRYNYEELEKHFNNKYTYREIKAVINEYYQAYYTKL